MAEDTNEKVIRDLALMEIDDLRFMARQNDLQFDGTKAELLSRIKAAFGFENEASGKVSRLYTLDSRSILVFN